MEPDRPIDWRRWHEDYDADTPLRRRLQIVQRHIRDVLDSFAGSPLRVASMCAGEGRDLLGAIAMGRRRDIVGRLVELDPELAGRARARADELGLDGLEVVVGDAGETASYAGAVPADLVLVCGVLGNISDADIETTLRALPMLVAPGGVAVWTRHRREPDVTPRIREWLADSGFVEVAYDPMHGNERLNTVGVVRFLGQTAPFVEKHLFTFNRTRL